MEERLRQSEALLEAIILIWVGLREVFVTFCPVPWSLKWRGVQRRSEIRPEMRRGLRSLLFVLAGPGPGDYQTFRGTFYLLATELPFEP